MAKNYLTRFATSSDANVLTDAELAAQPELASGFIAKSKASSKLIGKLIQNATAGSAALGEYIATKTQQDVSATDADLGTKLTNAITAHIKAEAPKQDLSSYATKSEVTEGLATKAAVKHTHTVDEVTNAVAYTTAAGRRSIVLQNDNDSISGLDTKSVGVNLLRVTASDTIDIGANQLNANINSKDNIVYINDLYQIATTEDLQQTSDSITAELAKKAPLASPTFTGTVTGTFKGNVTGNVTGNSSTATKATQDASGNVITTTYATKTELDTKAPLASPTFTGTVTAPTFAGALSGNATTATTATTANKTKAVLTLQMNGGSAQAFDGSTARTFNVTAAGIGALPTSGGTVSGSLTVNNELKAASITATSDIRLKNIINRYSTQSALYNLSAVDFSFKGSDDSVHTGLIAQEVQELYPALVKEDERGYLSIDYCGVTALLVNDMKHLLNKISRLEQQIEAIKRDI